MLVSKKGGSLISELMLLLPWDSSALIKQACSYTQAFTSPMFGMQWVNPFPQHAYFHRWNWDAAVDNWDKRYGEVREAEYLRIVCAWPVNAWPSNINKKVIKLHALPAAWGLNVSRA